jgi:hypothetical protein
MIFFATSKAAMVISAMLSVTFGSLFIIVNLSSRCWYTFVNRSFSILVSKAYVLFIVMHKTYEYSFLQGRSILCLDAISLGLYIVCLLSFPLNQILVVVVIVVEYIKAIGNLIQSNLI